MKHFTCPKQRMSSQCNAPFNNVEKKFTLYKVTRFYERWYGCDGVKFLFELDRTLSFHAWGVTKDEKIGF